MRSILLALSLLLLTTGFLVSVASAHGVGASLEKTVDDYVIDIGYQPPELRAGESIAFDFALLDKESSRGAGFSSVWARVAQGEKTVFAGGLEKKEIGPTTLVYTFPAGGEYELSARFQNAEGTLAEASFPLEVAGSAGNSGNSSFSLGSILIGAGAGLLVGFGASFAFGRKNTSTPA